MLPASSAFPATLFGTLWAGKVAVPLNFLMSPEELSGVVTDAGLDLVVTIGHFRTLVGNLSVRAIYLEELGLRRRLIFNLLCRRPRTPKVSAEDTAVMLYTSGTTAVPKGVELTYGNLRSNALDSIKALNIDGHIRMLNILPPFHVFGLTAGVLIPVALGASVVSIPRFSPVAVIKAAEAQGISMLMAVPSMYAAILKAKSAKPDSFRSVELAVSGGEPLPESVRRGFEERFGVVLRQGYGLTETSPVVSVCTREAYKVGTVGRPIPNVQLRIASSGEYADGEGEILVRGPGVMKGYHHRLEETQRVIDSEGWFHTGDVGRIDADGFLSITGRCKDMLIVGGENVFAREIEAALEAHEGVLQAAVIGVPDDLRGEVPVAFVIPRQGAEVAEAELRAFVKQSLAGLKVPRQVYVRADLPTGPTGKIVKRRLRELLPTTST